MKLGIATLQPVRFDIILLVPVFVFMQMGVGSVYFAGGSPFIQFADRLLYVISSLALAIAGIAVILRWSAPRIFPSLNEGESIIHRVADVAIIVMSTTLRIYIIYEVIKLLANQL